MGKNHRHKKKLKSEKAKTHITSKTKFLPKGQNVTNTKFQIRPIIVPEQLRESSSFTKRKLNITEALSRLKHHNEGIKVEACQNLVEVIKDHPLEEIHTHLGGIIQNASALLQDIERKVRKNAIKLIGAILERFPSAVLEPFINYVLTNLKCAMTNINRNIQEDCLELIDAFISFQSGFISNTIEVFLTDFLALISKLREHSGLERTLSLNLNAKISSVKWRIKVLTRLYGILEVTKPSFVQKNAVTEVRVNNLRFIRLENNHGGGTIETKPQYENTGVLVKLLYDSWLEVAPENAPKMGQSTVLSEEAFAVLSCTIKILNLLHDSTKIRKYEQTCTFLESLLRNFPYKYNKSPTSDFVKEFSKNFQISLDRNCTEENLLIIFLFMSNVDAANKTKIKPSQFMSYVSGLLASPKRLEAVPYMVNILQEVFIYRSQMWHQRGVNSLELLEQLRSRFSRGHIPESAQSEVLEILTESHIARRNEKHQEWLKELPRFLAREKVSGKLIDVVLKLCRENNQHIQQGLRMFLREVLESLPGMQIVHSRDVEQSKRHLAYVFYFLNDVVDDSDMKCFVNNPANHSCCKYLRQILNINII